MDRADITAVKRQVKAVLAVAILLGGGGILLSARAIILMSDSQHESVVQVQHATNTTLVTTPQGEWFTFMSVPIECQAGSRIWAIASVSIEIDFDGSPTGCGYELRIDATSVLSSGFHFLQAAGGAYGVSPLTIQGTSGPLPAGSHVVELRLFIAGNCQVNKLGNSTMTVLEIGA